jgi:hypothetical protein
MMAASLKINSERPPRKSGTSTTRHRIRLRCDSDTAAAESVLGKATRRTVRHTEAIQTIIWMAACTRMPRFSTSRVFPDNTGIRTP